MAKLKQIKFNSLTKLSNESISDSSRFSCSAEFEIKNSLGFNDKVKIDPRTGYAKLETILFAAGELSYTENDVEDPRYAGIHTIMPEELKSPEFLHALKALDIVIRHQDIDVNSYGDEIIPDGQIADAWWDEAEQVVKGTIVIKDKEAINKVVNRELWGGSLQYGSKFKFENGKIYQTCLLPEHWALTNVPRDDRVRLNNEKSIDRSNIMTPEEIAAKEAAEKEAAEKLENEGEPTEPTIEESMSNMQSMIEGMGEQIAVLAESVKSMTPEPAAEMANEEINPVVVAEPAAPIEPEKPSLSDAVLEILVNSYAVKNNIAAEELKNAIEEVGMDSAINTYEKAMGIAANMAGGTPAEDAPEIDPEDVAAQEASNEKDIDEPSVKNEKPQKDYLSELTC